MRQPTKYMFISSFMPSLRNMLKTSIKQSSPYLTRLQPLLILLTLGIPAIGHSTNKPDIAALQQSVTQLEEEIKQLEHAIVATDRLKTEIDEQLKVLDLMRQNLEQEADKLEEKKN